MAPQISYLARQIRARRDTLGVTQGRLSELSGVHRQVIAKLETGKQQDLYGENIASLARALQTTTDALLGLQRSPQPTVGATVVERYLASTLLEFDRPTKGEVAWLRALDASV